MERLLEDTLGAEGEKPLFGLKRKTRDPLWRTFLDKYNLNLLAVPREDVAIGDLYPYDGRRVGQPGNVRYILKPPLRISAKSVTTGKMADVSGTLTDSVSFDIGLNILEGFLSAMGVGGVVGDIRAEYETKGTMTVRYRFVHAVRDKVDPLSLGSMLINHQVRKDHPLLTRDYQYFLVTAVARSPSISVVAEGKKQTRLDIDAKALQGIVGGSGGVSVEKSTMGELTYKGKAKLAFGVEVYELRFDRDTMKMSLRIPAAPPRMKLLTSYEPLVIPAPEPAFIGGPEGDLFITFI